MKVGDIYTSKGFVCNNGISGGLEDLPSGLYKILEPELKILGRKGWELHFIERGRMECLALYPALDTNQKGGVD